MASATSPDVLKLGADKYGRELLLVIGPSWAALVDPAGLDNARTYPHVFNLRLQQGGRVLYYRDGAGAATAMWNAAYTACGIPLATLNGAAAAAGVKL